MGDNDATIASKGSTDKTMKIAMLGPNGQPLVPPHKGGGKKPGPEKPGGDENPTWFFGLGIGSGVGWTSGHGEIFSEDKVDPPGFAMAKLMHFAPEVGYYLSPDLLLSVQLRLQLISGATEYISQVKTDCGGDGVCSPGSYAFAGFARATYFFGEGDLRTYVAGNLGLGTIRHMTTFESQKTCGSDMHTTCIDTVPSGPVFAGVGAGIMYNVSPAFILTFGTNALAGFTKFTFNVDLNAGVAFEY